MAGPALTFRKFGDDIFRGFTLHVKTPGAVADFAARVLQIRGFRIGYETARFAIPGGVAAEIPATKILFILMGFIGILPKIQKLRLIHPFSSDCF